MVIIILPADIYIFLRLNSNTSSDNSMTEVGPQSPFFCSAAGGSVTGGKVTRGVGAGVSSGVLTSSCTSSWTGPATTGDTSSLTISSSGTSDRI